MRINALVTLTFLFLLTTRYTHSQSNLHHPEFTQNEYTENILEDANIGTIVLTVEANDSDGHVVTYYIEGESHNFFLLNEASGVITVDHELDREAQDLIKFNVTIIILLDSLSELRTLCVTGGMQVYYVTNYTTCCFLLHLQLSKNCKGSIISIFNAISISR